MTAARANGLPSVEEKRSFVREMFTAIAPRYDFLNHVLSFNLDRRWRRQAVDALAWESRPSGQYLDLCAGTLDLAVELQGRSGFNGSVVGADFAVPMLSLGRHKDRRVVAVGADAVQLPFPDETFDGCMVAFGIRNLESVDAGLAEMARVIKPGGRVVILEFSLPRRWPMRPLYLGYFRFVLPHVGRLVSKHTSAYGYLPDSVHAFPEPARVVGQIGAHGFGAVRHRSLTFGVTGLYDAVRQGT
jgi:demethylmenaquinone methyltransferase/2-methoxy-6-polyprenyl-1,4-benzoquinol methylase